MAEPGAFQNVNANLVNLTLDGNLVAGNIAINSGTLVGNRLDIQSVTADDNLTVSESGKLFVFTDAGAVLTLPDSGSGGTVIGVYYDFISNFTATAPGQKVKCSDTDNEKLIGTLVASDTDADTTVRCWNAQSSDNFSAVNLSSAATGMIGSRFRITCIAADTWNVQGVVVQSGGSEATPFATS